MALVKSADCTQLQLITGIWLRVAKSLGISRRAKTKYYGKRLEFENISWAKQSMLMCKSSVLF